MTSVSENPSRGSLTLVWAETNNRVIGLDGDMPWSVPEDLRHFQQVTAGKTVLMGRRTWESLPERVRPLKGRRNVILTRSEVFRDSILEQYPDVRVFASWGQAFAEVAGEDVAVIGGANLFQRGIGVADMLEVTRLDIHTKGDTFAPVFHTFGEGADVWSRVDGVYEADWQVSVSGVRYRFERWARPNV